MSLASRPNECKTVPWHGMDGKTLLVSVCVDVAHPSRRAEERTGSRTGEWAQEHLPSYFRTGCMQPGGVCHACIPLLHISHPLQILQSICRTSTLGEMTRRRRTVPSAFAAFLCQHHSAFSHSSEPKRCPTRLASSPPPRGSGGRQSTRRRPLWRFWSLGVDTRNVLSCCTLAARQHLSQRTLANGRQPRRLALRALPRPPAWWEERSPERYQQRVRSHPRRTWEKSRLNREGACQLGRRSIQRPACNTRARHSTNSGVFAKCPPRLNTRCDTEPPTSSWSRTDSARMSPRRSSSPWPIHSHPICTLCIDGPAHARGPAGLGTCQGSRRERAVEACSVISKLWVRSPEEGLQMPNPP
ncbi:hypothetical protein C8Q80DRAFT_812357 [Daedaleopsis nitida]|nr:hypothetical protein C8Q80DRAFT_812357 [Daedaleopsis nitida]